MQSLMTAKFQTWTEFQQVNEIVELMAKLRKDIEQLEPFTAEYTAKVKLHNELSKLAKKLS